VLTRARFVALWTTCRRAAGKDGDGVILVNKLGKTEDRRKWSEEKTRNETDIIRSRLTKTIQQELADDPYAQAVFSALLKQAIAEAEAMFNHPYKQYMLYNRTIEQKVSGREIDTVPDVFGSNNHAKVITAHSACPGR